MTELDNIIIQSISPSNAGKRLDKVLAEMFPDFSRSCLQNWLKAGFISLDGNACLPKHKVLGDEVLRIEIPPAEASTVVPENLPLDCVYEDADIIVINKPAGLVVHPAAGNWAGTLQNGLLYHYPDLEGLPRAGLVHRLDKDTSGLLVVARSLRAHKSLIEQLQRREASREYDAVAQGVLVAGGVIDEPIGRHPVDRKRMAVRKGGRDAITHYRIAERFRLHTHLRIKLETGRTHQIRVHMAHIKKPLIGDPVYGSRLKIPAACEAGLREQLQGFKRQALHAAHLGIIHPATAEPINWQVPMPDDLQNLLSALRQDTAVNGQSQ